MSENIIMCKVAHFCTVLCAILTQFCAQFLFVKPNTISCMRQCVVLGLNAQNRTSRGPYPIPAPVDDHSADMNHIHTWTKTCLSVLVHGKINFDDEIRVRGT